MTANRYGNEARAYWRRWLPQRYAELPDPVAFFTALGEQVEQMVGDLWDAMVDEDAPPADEGHEQRVGRLGRLKAEAEYQVLAEMVRLTPEPGALAEPEDDGLESDEQFESRLRQVHEQTERLAATADGLVDGRLSLDDLTDEQLRELLNYMTPSFLRLFGTSATDLRAHGRKV